MDCVLQVVGHIHKISSKMRVVVLAEDGKQACDEMRTVDHNFTPASHHTIKASVINQVIQDVQSEQTED